MSTFIYLKCLDHDPPLFAPDESGQHLYDLPQIRADIANREAVVAAYEADEYGVNTPYFLAHTAQFLTRHTKCRIGIEDEYGREHSLEADS